MFELIYILRWTLTHIQIVTHKDCSRSPNGISAPWVGITSLHISVETESRKESNDDIVGNYTVVDRVEIMGNSLRNIWIRICLADVLIIRAFSLRTIR